jgi:hypothetical protein
MQREKRGRICVGHARFGKRITIVLAILWYTKVQIKRFGVDLDSTVDNELAEETLQAVDEVGVADRCLDEPFWPPFFLYDR